MARKHKRIKKGSPKAFVEVGKENTITDFVKLYPQHIIEAEKKLDARKKLKGRFHYSIIKPEGGGKTLLIPESQAKNASDLYIIDEYTRPIVDRHRQAMSGKKVIDKSLVQEMRANGITDEVILYVLRNLNKHEGWTIKDSSNYPAGRKLRRLIYGSKT